MRGTRLFQQAGSPLIQGRSRTERPFWRLWLLAFVLAVLAWGLVEVVYALATTPAVDAPSVAETVLGTARRLPGGALVGALLGSAAGVFVARGAGVRRSWVSGAVVGAAGAVVVSRVLGPTIASWVVGS